MQFSIEDLKQCPAQTGSASRLVTEGTRPTAIFIRINIDFPTFNCPSLSAHI